MGQQLGSGTYQTSSVAFLGHTVARIRTVSRTEDSEATAMHSGEGAEKL